jgi:hypothetical protein
MYILRKSNYIKGKRQGENDLNNEYIFFQFQSWNMSY